MRKLHSMLKVFIAVIFVFYAGWQIYIFYHLLRHQSVTLWENNVFINRMELATAIGILALAVYLFINLWRDYTEDD